MCAFPRVLKSDIVGCAHDVMNIMAERLPIIDVGSVDDEPP